MRRQPAKPGDVVRIEFDSDTYTYGRALKHPFVAVYDCKTNVDIDDLDRIVARPILFVVAVMDRALRSARWRIVGNVPLGEGEIPIPDQFIQDRFNPQACQIIDASGRSRDATIDECEGLEAAAVWEAEHLEERMRDHYAGRRNVDLDMTRLRRP